MTAPPLVILLASARDELAAETPIRIHTSHAPKLTDADGSATHDTDEGGVGLPFTGAFHRILSIRERPRQTEYLMRGSLLEVADWCLRQHPTHEEALCGRIVMKAVRSGWDTLDIAYLVAYPEPVVRSMLINALQHAAGWRHERSSARKPTAADLIIQEVDRRRAHRSRMYDAPLGDVRQERTAHGGT